MAKSKKGKKEEGSFDLDAFAADMIKDINEELGEEIAYNLGISEDPAKIKKWYSTGSKLLNAICSGDIDKGLPAGRVVEVSGPESIGKSHIAYQVARAIMENGGLVNYADTEKASSIENLRSLGIDVDSKRFIYAKPSSIEQTFENCEAFLKNIMKLPKKVRDEVDVGFFFDSVAAIGSKKEREIAMTDHQQPGLNAKQMTFGLRRIIDPIDKANCLFFAVNQVYDKLNAGMYEKKTTTKLGKGIRYQASIRLELQAVRYVYPDEMDKQKAVAAGVQASALTVRCSTVKNKVSSPNRMIEFNIVFGKGIEEHMQIWEMFAKAGEIATQHGTVKVANNGAWKELVLFDSDTGEILKTTGKFRKKETKQQLAGEHEQYWDEALRVLMHEKMFGKDKENIYVNPTSSEISETAKEMADRMGEAFEEL